MELLDAFMFACGNEKRSIEIYQGDLTEMSPDEAVDILVVSAIPNDYIPTKRSLIGALHQKGVSVALLADDKQVDLRESCSCWLSKEIQSTDPGIQFKHILCFEPKNLQSPSDVVGGIFRSLIPFISGGTQVKQVAMPLVSTGVVGARVADMVEALFTAAINWMEKGLPLEKLKIVERSPIKAAEMKGAFAILKKQHKLTGILKQRNPKYDIFVSYCHQNAEEANSLIQELKRLKPDLRIFIDYQDLEPGVAWQEKLYRSINESRKVMAVYSPAYIDSKACQEEFNFASLLDSQLDQKTLFPLLVYETDLLPHMLKWQYIDCKIANKDKMKDACQRLIKELSM